MWQSLFYNKVVGLQKILFKNTFFYRTQNTSGGCFWKKIIEFLNYIIESLLKTNDSSILVSVFLRKNHIKNENIFYSDIFKYERRLTKYDLIPEHGLLQRSFIQWNVQTIVTAYAFLHFSSCVYIF